MASIKIAPPFILPAEGGFVDNPNDRGGATNKGITWREWQIVFGDTTASWNRFLVMSSDDWMVVFKSQFWDKIQGDAINSPRIALTIADWYFNSGRYAAVDVQVILDNLFGDHLAEDGCIGTQTVQAINAADEPIFYADLIAKRLSFYEDIVEHNPSQQVFLQGWKNRLTKLQAYNSTLAA
jgi:lysozyme family protein